MAGGNLQNWGIVKQEEVVVVPKKGIDFSVIIAKSKLYGHTIAIIVMAVVVGLSSAYQWYETYKDKDVIPVVIAKEDVPEVKEEVKDLEQEATDLTNKAIERSNKPLKAPDNNISSRFTSPNIRADLVYPDKPVDVYKLVKIRTDEQAKFFDLFVMTVNKGKIIFVDSVATATPGEWVFTGPPGDYAIRLSAYNPDIGVHVTVGNVVIGENPNPPPGPEPPPVTKVIVPTLTGLTYPQAKAFLESLGLKIRAQNIEAGKIVWQSPDANTVVDKGSTVIIDTDDGVVPPPPPPPIFTEKYGFSTLSYDVVATKVPATDKQFAAKLAGNFEAVAAGIAAGSWRTPDEANKELGGLNRLTLNNDSALIGRWMPFFDAWSLKAKELNLSGKLPNMASEYRLVYLETAAGLKAIK